jgi:hypothetical protein
MPDMGVPSLTVGHPTSKDLERELYWRRTTYRDADTLFPNYALNYPAPIHGNLSPSLQYPDQGSILWTSVSAENISDKFSSSKFGLIYARRQRILIYPSIRECSFNFYCTFKAYKSHNNKIKSNQIIFM